MPEPNANNPDSVTRATRIKRILIVGGGWVGRQIAAQAAGHGLHVTVSDVRPELSEQAVAWGLKHIQTQVAQKSWLAIPTPMLNSISWELAKSETPVGNWDWIIESVTEQVSIKRRVLREISETFPAPAIITSNSSYFVPSMLAKYVQSPERFAHVHFHVPVWISSIVDVVPCASTSQDVLDELCLCSRLIGQTPILERTENPGYIFNWLLQALLRAALELSDRQVASPTDIDFVWKKITGMPLGPFGIMDQIGIDVIHQVLANARWTDKSVDLQRLIDLLQPMVDQGHLGLKTGEGFFRYPESE